jgi:hypothetical protein
MCGVPASGKTSFAIKVVECVNSRYRTSHPVSVTELGPYWEFDQDVRFNYG